MRANKQEITLTLDMAWDLCLEQWAWIKAQIEAGSNLSVNALKDQWCKGNGYEGVRCVCFFCEYVVHQHSRIAPRRCGNCPGKLVDPEFHCNNKEYHHCYKPLEFHAELVRLNKIRLGLKKNSEEPYAC